MVCKDDIILQMRSVKNNTCIQSYLIAVLKIVLYKFYTMLRIKQKMNIKSNNISLILQKKTRYQQLKQSTRNHEWVLTS